ncbi:VldV [Streptomyces hygroscopicus]|uniref:DUF1326 domain-containing protein n=1 Tax=Streptomyces hygroscopicus TaxID=1912 RepID=UPI00223EF1E2|nr:DUF1326 domain-containing protein [Streptomyces hygroscopicus]MCW7944503.1 VldV [Streptomyces hygroscopicus]
MAWNLSGTYVESCNCDVVCPCTTSGLTAPADQERCQVTLAFNVASGEIDGVDVAGLSVVVFADTPRVMAEGGWQVVLYVDGSADDSQAEALGKVFSGQVGGPMAAVTPLIGEVLGVERVPIDHLDEGRRHTVRVADAIDIEIEDQVAPQFGEDGPVMGLTGMFHPANSTLTVARSTRAVGNDVHGRSWDFTGRNGHSASFSWSA